MRLTLDFAGEANEDASTEVIIPSQFMVCMYI